MATYQVCSKCVMDTSDTEISFDSSGVCNHCSNFALLTPDRWFPNEIGRKKLEKLVRDIKYQNRNKPYDCVMGISGGIDSSYLALLLRRYDLRVLAIHVDAGWNSELAVSNIKTVLDHCEYDLYTKVIDWDVMRRLQLAYLKSGLSNQDVPQDHVFFATIYKTAIKKKIATIMNGGNIATEFVFPRSWHADAMDSINLRSVFNTHGEGTLSGYETIGPFFLHFIVRYVGLKKLNPLNFVDYNKFKAQTQLESIGWKNYSTKHGESIFTKYFQNHILPTRYGYDKRRPHLSSLILSGQITRQDALEKLEKPLYNETELEADTIYICKKLELSPEKFRELLALPQRQYTEYLNWDRKLANIKALKSGLVFLKRKIARLY